MNKKLDEARALLRDSGYDVASWAMDNKVDAAVAFIVSFTLGVAFGVFVV